ncbi:MAG: calcium/sodium antiporter [Alistipes sp.]|nr:calcium/sodium antiporter [Alistipes sp.]
MDFLILVASLALIIVGSMWLTDGSVALAERLKVPQFIVGLTIVAVGTSMPELVVSFLSAWSGHTDMAIGNVVGSNIFNTFLILGVCSLFSPILFTKKNIRRDIPMCIFAAVALLVVTLLNQDITRFEGLLLLVGYIAMMYLTVRADKREMKENSAPVEEEKPAKQMPVWKIPVWIILGLGGLIWGGNLFVTSATNVAHALGVSEAVIAITLVAGGTSLPELASSLVSIIKGSPSLALGNVLGSNIANILLILGTCSTVKPLTMGGVTMFDIYVAVAATGVVMLSALVIGRDKLTRIEGLLFVGCYIAYVYTLI